MKASDIIKLGVALIQAKITRPLHIVGSPGIGKTALGEQIANTVKANNSSFGFTVFHAAQALLEDYGMPMPNADKTSIDFLVPETTFPIEGSKHFPETGLMIIDELDQCNAPEQKMLANVLHARTIRGKKIKPGWFFIATGNRVTDKAGANRLLTHLNERLTRVEFDVSLDDWCQWALANGIKPEVISLMRFKPALLNQFSPDAVKNANPRTWANGVSAAYGAIPQELEFETFKGMVGEGPASEAIAYFKMARKLVHPDVIILNPKTAPLPKSSELDVMYCIVGALAHKTTKNNFGRIMEYIERLPAEFGVLFIRDVVKLCPDITTTKEFCVVMSGPMAKLLT